MKKVQSYMKNLGNSIKYATIDVSKDMAPTIADTIETNSELFREITDVIRDRKQVFRRTKDIITRGKVYEAADQLKTSIFQDIASGQLYNKARKDDIDSRILGMDDMSFDSGDFSMDGFDDSDFGADDFGDDFNDSSFNEDFTSGDRHISETVLESSRISSQAIASAVSRSTEYAVESQKQMFEFETMSNIENFKNVNTNLQVINENIGKLVSFNEEINSIQIQNSTTYFEETTNIMKENNAILKEMLELDRNRYGEDSEKSKSSTIGYDDVFGASGAMDVKEYAAAITQKLNSKLSGITGMNETFGEDSNLLLTFAASPLEFIPKMTVANIIGNNLKGSVKRLNKSVSSFFSSMITRFNTMARDENPIFNTIGEIFGLDNRLNLKTNTSNYEKGPVPWDGKARQALMEVIPTHLAKLVALQSGINEKIYDYDNGRFVDSSEIKTEFDRMVKSEVKSSTSDVREEMNRMINDTFAFRDLDQKDNLKKDMDEFFTHFFKSGDLFDYNRKEFDDFDMDFKDEDNYKIIKNVFKNLPGHLQLQFNRDIIEGRQSLNERVRSSEKDGDSLYRHLENNSGIKDIKDEIDPYTGAINITEVGENSLTYLRKISNTLLEGIKVYVTNSMRLAGGEGGDPNPNDESSISAILGRVLPSENDNTRRQREHRDMDTRESRNTEFINREATRAEDHGLNYMDDVLAADSESSIDSLVSVRRDIYNTRRNANQNSGFIEDLLRGSGLYEKYKVVNDKVRDVFDSPMNAMSSMLNKVDTRLYQIIYGTEEETEYGGERVRGFMDMLMVDLRSTFTTFNNWMDEMILTPLQDKLSGFGNKITDGILMGLGMNMTGKEFKDKTKSYLFGSKDEDGNYITKGLFSSLSDQIKSDLKGVKEYVLGKNSTFKKVYSLVESYTYDKSKWNEIDQTILLSDVSDALNKFRSKDKDEIKIANNIKDKISGVSTEDLPEVIKYIYKVLNSNGYGRKDTSIFGILKSSFTKGKDLTVGTTTKIDDMFKNITRNRFTRDRFKNDSDKLNANKFLSLMASLKQYLVETNYSKKVPLLDKIKNHILDINDENLEETDVKKSLLYIYNKGILSVNEANPNKMVSRLINKLKIYVPDPTISKILNIFGNKPTGANDNESTEGSGGIGGVLNNLRDNISEGFQGMFDTDEADGSHKKGLKRVPFDGYKAIVHKDESILTRQQTDEYERILKDFKNGSDEDTGLNIINKLKSDIDKFSPRNELDGDSKNNIKNILDTFTGNNTEDILNNVLEESRMNRKARGIDKEDTLLNNMIKEFKSMYSGTQRMLFGTDDIEKDEKKISDRFKSAVGDIMGNVKEYLPSMGSGAMIGGGVGLLGGLLGGPLAWAAIGSAVSLTKSSSKVQEYLFGGTDEEGKDFKGIVPDKLMKGIEKYAPDMKKFGVTGAALGLLPFVPGGIMGGLMLGSATAFAKNNSSVQEYLFGEDGLIGEDGAKKAKDVASKMLPGSVIGALGGLATLGPIGLIGGAMLGSATSYASTTDKFKEVVFGKDKEGGLLGNGRLDKIKEVLPKALVGTLAVGAFGPLGLLGSAAVGSSLGMISSTDHFKDNIFGEAGTDGKRKGGLLGDVKGKINSFIDDNIKKPFSESLAPFKQEAKLIGKSMKESITNSIDSVFKESFGMPIKEMVDEKIVKPFTSVFKKLFNGLGKVIGSVVASPFKVMKFMSDELKEKHIRDGDDDYLKDEPKDDDSVIDNVREDIGSRGNSRDKRSLFNKLNGKIMSSYNSAKDIYKSTKDNTKSKLNEGLNNIKVKKATRERRTPSTVETNSDDSEDGEPEGSSGFRRVRKGLKVNDNGKLEKELSKRDTLIEDLKAQVLDLSEIVRKREKSENVGKVRDDKSKPEELATNNDLKDIRKFTSIISDEISGQLDGVGYNIETIKNVLVQNLGFPDESATGLRTGRGNRKRKGIFATILGFVTNPLKALKGIGKSLLFGKDGESGMLGWAVKAGKHVKSMLLVPFKAVGKIYESVKGIGGMISSAVKAIGPAVGEALKGVGAIVKGAGHALGLTLKGIGEGIGKASVHLLEGVGILGKEFIKLTTLVPKLVGSLASLTASVGKAALKFGGKIAKGVGTAVNMGMSALFKDKFTVKNIVSTKLEGGYLDSITSIGTVEVVKSIDELKSILKPVDINNNNSKEDDSKSPLNRKRRNINKDNTDRHNKNSEDDTTSLPTEYGIIKYRKDRSGARVPVENKAYESLMSAHKKRDSVFDQIKNATSRNAEESASMSEKLNIFGGDKDGKGGILGGLVKFGPIFALMLPLLPKLLDMAGGLLEKFGLKNPMDKVNDVVDNVVGSDSNALATPNKVIGRAIISRGVRGKGITGKALSLTKKAVENTPKAMSVINKMATKIFGNPKIIAVVSKILPKSGAKICNDIATKIGPMIAKKLGDLGTNSLVKQLTSKAFPVTAIALAAYDITSGMANADRILQVKGDVPVNVKLATGLAKAANNFFTFGLVPLKWLVQIMLKFVATDNQRTAIKDSQKELRTEFEKYKKDEAKKGVNEKDMMDFDAFNKNEHRGIIGRTLDKLNPFKKKKKAPENGKGNSSLPFYSQNDKRWNKNGNKMSETGCGPTSAAMAIKGMTGKNINPLDADRSSKRHRDSDGGTRPSYFNEIFSKFGINSKTHLLDEEYGGTSKNMSKLLRALSSGSPTVIMGKSNNPNSVFGKDSHYIVANGIDGKGNIQINDPSSNGSKSVPASSVLPDSKLAVESYGKGNTKMPLPSKVLKPDKLDHGKGNSSLDKTVILSLIELMKKIVDNTDHLSVIKSLLSSGLNLNVSEETINKIKPVKGKGSNSVAVIAGGGEKEKSNNDSNLKELLSILEAIATE